MNNSENSDNHYKIFKDSEQVSTLHIPDEENQIKPILKKTNSNSIFTPHGSVSFNDESYCFRLFRCFCNRYNISIVLITSVLTTGIMIIIYLFVLKKDDVN